MVRKLSRSLTSRLVSPAIGQQPRATGVTDKSVFPRRRNGSAFGESIENVLAIHGNEQGKPLFLREPGFLA
jgi:hypothetical protein